MYQGSSEAFHGLVDDYFSYAMTVNLGRALPDVRDGLKVVHRRMLQMTAPIKKLEKSATVTGRVLEMHPHGDAAVYDALVLMTDSREAWNVPLYKGQGTFGKVYSTLPASSSRYTEVMPNEQTLPFLEFLPFCPTTERDKGTEPEVLSAPFPFVLTVGHTGVGVGSATNIPPYNAHDVIELTLHYLRNKSFDDLYILPDFPTGGFVFDDPVAALKSMYTGKGTYSVRATYEITPGRIFITEVPYGTTVEGLESVVNGLANEYEEVLSASNAISLNGCGLEIFVKKGSEEAVERLLYRKGVLHSTYSPSMVWVNGSEIHSGGVYRIIEEWVDFRREIGTKFVTHQLEANKAEQARLGYFIHLITHSDLRDAYIDRVVNQNKQSADSYLRSVFANLEGFEPIPADVVDWIYSRRLSSFNRASTHLERYNKLADEILHLEGFLHNIDLWVIEQLESYHESIEGKYERRTDSSNIRLKFSKSSTKKEEPSVPCSFQWNTKQGTIVKTERIYDKVEGMEVFHGDSRDTLLLGLTPSGEIVKVWADALEWNVPTSFTSYAKVDTAPFFILPADSPDQLLVYTDGYLSLFSPSSFSEGKRTRKVKALPELINLAGLLPLDETETISWIGSLEGTPIISTVHIPSFQFTRQMKTRKKAFDNFSFNAWGTDLVPSEWWNGTYQFPPSLQTQLTEKLNSY